MSFNVGGIVLILFIIMLNEASQGGILDILSEFDDNNLFALASTVTQGLLKNKIESREGESLYG